ncbi:hypothetical protein AAHC03_016676 [Spirometra sp. Aus1]
MRAENDKDIYLNSVLESDLHKVIKRGNILKDVHKKFITYQLLKAALYIHSGNVIHRDLKPSNVLLDSECTVKVCDFGLTRSLTQRHPKSGTAKGDSTDPLEASDPSLTEYVATRWYRAPEILLSSTTYTKGVDMWSLGCIVAEMFLGKPLFPGTSTLNQLERIMTIGPRPTREDIDCLRSEYGVSLLEKPLPKPLKTLDDIFPTLEPSGPLDFLKRLLVLNPNKRLTAEEALEHNFVQKFRDKSTEIRLNRAILPPLDDCRQLSVADYRSRLYKMIMTKKAERRQEHESHNMHYCDSMAGSDEQSEESEVCSSPSSSASSTIRSASRSTEISRTSSTERPSRPSESSHKPSRRVSQSRQMRKSSMSPRPPSNRAENGARTKLPQTYMVRKERGPTPSRAAEFQMVVRRDQSSESLNSRPHSHASKLKQSRSKTPPERIPQKPRRHTSLSRSKTISEPHRSAGRGSSATSREPSLTRLQKQFSRLPQTFSRAAANPTILRSNTSPGIRSTAHLPNPPLQNRYFASTSTFGRRQFENNKNRTTGAFCNSTMNSRSLAGRNMDRLHTSPGFMQPYASITQSQLNDLHSRTWIR